MSDSGLGPQPPVEPGAGQQPAGPSVCPRHPDREAYVRCQRCGRPACPECQRPAPVGIQCVDCVREAAQTVPRTRTVLGGRATDGRPVVTYSLIGLCVAVFLAQWVSDDVTNDYAFMPILGWTEPWRFVTAMFLHAPQSLLHIGFNMYALYILGTYLEPLLGRARFLALYLISGIGGQVAVLLFAGNPTGHGPVDPGGRGLVYARRRGLGRDLRPLRRPDRAQPAPQPVCRGDLHRPGHQRGPRLRRARHLVAGAPRRLPHRPRQCRAPSCSSGVSGSGT